MASRMLVGSRKGLFILEPERKAAWRIAREAFLGQPVSMVMHDPRDGALYVALNLGHFGAKLHRSDDGGTSWTEVAAPAFPKAEGDEKAPSVGMVWALEPAGADMPGVIWAGTMPAGLFRSEDKGGSWSLNAPFEAIPGKASWFGGGNDAPGLHSIALHPRDSRRMILGISCGGAWATEDAGQSWTGAAKGMWAAYMPPEERENPNTQDPHRIVRCRDHPDTLWIQHHNAQFRSTDGAKEWNTISETFGFAVAAHPRDPETAWFVPAQKDEMRIPSEGDFCVLKTEDGGRSFRRITAGLPGKPCYDLIYRHALDVDGDGRDLAFGSTTGNLWASGDSGESWRVVSHHLPPIYCLKLLQ
ncbi:MAG TPA: hypothetical protein VMT54_21405 [Candidatus Cybelea sp.]|nr:hypothetical protein [Candidatus Cybelea sp.]